MHKIISTIGEANNKVHGLLQEIDISQEALIAICEILETGEKNIRGILEHEQKGYENNTIGVA